MGGKITGTFAFVNSISVIFCCTHSGKTKVNCLKYIVKKCPYIFPFNIFLYVGSRFLTSKLGPMENKESFLLIKNPCDLHFAQYFFCCTLYLVYNKEFPLIYIIG